MNERVIEPDLHMKYRKRNRRRRSLGVSQENVEQSRDCDKHFLSTEMPRTSYNYVTMLMSVADVDGGLHEVASNTSQPYSPGKPSLE